MVQVKICGLTSLEDALTAAQLGADLLGFVFAKSPRQVTPNQAREIIRELPTSVLTVGVFVNSTLEEIGEIREYCGLGAVQLHGEETEEMVAALDGCVIKALQVGIGSISCEEYPGALLLLDTYCPSAFGGTGKTFNWNLAVEPALHRPVILAGGLTPDNVAAAVETVRPYAVDVSGGVEAEPGRKDYEKLERFIFRAKSL